MTEFTGLMEIARQNLMKMDQKQISEISQKIKNASSSGSYLVGYSEYNDGVFRSATIKFLENEGFEVSYSSPKIYQIYWKLDLDKCGPFYQEVKNLYCSSHRNKLISFIKCSTAEGENRMIYTGIIDD